jgi:hypothetical protein
MLLSMEFFENFKKNGGAPRDAYAIKLISPFGNASRPGQNRSRPCGIQARPGWNETRPAKVTARPCRNGARAFDRFIVIKNQDYP